MPRHIVLLRGINLATNNRIAMPALRGALEKSGFQDVATYLQSGNVILSSTSSPESVARKCRDVIAKTFRLQIPVVVRSRDELAAVVDANPLKKVATDPRRYQVSFFDNPLDRAVVKKLEDALVAPERLVVAGREAYAWHPNGIGRSKLWEALAGRGLGVTATARNWRTVTTLLDRAED